MLKLGIVDCFSKMTLFSMWMLSPSSLWSPRSASFAAMPNPQTLPWPRPRAREGQENLAGEAPGSVAWRPWVLGMDFGRFHQQTSIDLREKNRNPWVFPDPDKQELACKLVHNMWKQMRIVSQHKPTIYGDMIWYRHGSTPWKTSVNSWRLTSVSMVSQNPCGLSLLHHHLLEEGHFGIGCHNPHGFKP